MTRMAVLCSLFIRVNSPVNVFMINFACNGQTSVILFAYGVAVSIHCYYYLLSCLLKGRQLRFLQNINYKKKQQYHVLFCSWGSSPINFRLSKGISSSRSLQNTRPDQAQSVLRQAVCNDVRVVIFHLNWEIATM